MSTPACVLKEIQVADLGMGMAAALVTKFLRELGARVRRLEPVSGDPFYDLYPAYELWQAGKEIVYSDTDRPTDLMNWMAATDICVIGGEDYPGLDWCFDTEELQRFNSRLIVLKIEATLAVEGEEPLIANDLLAQARSGFSFEHYSDRPIAFGFPAPTYGAVFNAIVGVLTALIDRERTGKGQVVSVSLLEGALDACRSSWFQAEKTDMKFMAQVPKDTRMTIFKCKDGKYVHLMMGTPGAKDRFYKLLNLNPDDLIDTLDDRGMPTGRGDPSMFWGDIDAFARPVTQWTRDEFVKLLQDNDFPCMRVSAPGECWDLPQVAENGIIVTDAQGRQYVSFPLKGL